jgi:NAD(P)H-dependent FMN reductase
MGMMKSFIPVLLGSSRIGRKSLGVAHFIVEKLHEHARIHTELLDLATYNLPIMEQRLQEMEQLPPGLGEFSDKLRRADGLLMVVPEYKNGYPGVLKNALDYLESGILQYKPVAICTVSSGEFGGLNCLAQLRLVCLALGGVPIPGTLPVCRVQETFEVGGTPRDPRLAKRLEPFLEELLWYVEAMVAQRMKTAGATSRRGLILAASAQRQ